MAAVVGEDSTRLDFDIFDPPSLEDAVQKLKDHNQNECFVPKRIFLSIRLSAPLDNEVCIHKIRAFVRNCSSSTSNQFQLVELRLESPPGQYTIPSKQLASILLQVRSRHHLVQLDLFNLRIVGGLQPVTKAILFFATSVSNLKRCCISCCKFILHQHHHHHPPNEEEESPLALAQALCRLPRLESLMFDLKSWDSSTEECVQIADMFCRKQSVTRLGLCRFPTTSTTTPVPNNDDNIPAFQRYCDSIQHSPFLETVNFYKSKLSDEHVKIVGEMLKANRSTLKTLSLEVEEGTSLLPLVEALETNRSLQDMEVRGATSQALEPAFDLLLGIVQTQNYTLQSFQVGFREFRQCTPKYRKKKSEEIDFYCQHINQRLPRQRLLTDMTFTVTEFWQILVQIIVGSQSTSTEDPSPSNNLSDISTIYYVLSARPDLWIGTSIVGVIENY